jgi:hypothetical protein
MAETGPQFSGRDLESAWGGWHQRLCTQSRATSSGRQPLHLYILADSRANPDLDKLLAQVPGLKWESLWRGSVLESYTDIAPYLIHIDRFALEDDRNLETRLARRLWREGAHKHMLTWLWSPSRLEVLGAHFRSFGRYVTPDQHAYFLHFYDNRILERLRQVWSMDEAQAFLAPCSEIWYSDRDLHDVVWENAMAPAYAVSDGERIMSLEQHAELFRLGYADKLCLQLRDIYGAGLDNWTDADLYRAVSEQIERASRYRITTENDLLSFVSKGIVISSRFDEHPVINDRLNRARNGEIAHVEALGKIDRGILNEAARMQGRPESATAEGTS